MPGNSDDKQTAVAYVPDGLYESWVDHADDLGVSVSRLIIQMVEAGRKDTSMDDVSTDSIRHLRQQRNDLQQEVERQRERIEDLERQLQHTAQPPIVEFVEDNPGAATAEIIQRVADTVPARVAGHLDALEGSKIEQRDDGYHPLSADE